MKKLSFFGVLLLSAFYFLFSSTAHAATLSLLPSTTTVEVGDTLNVSLLLDTQGVSVNAVQAVIHFSPEKLQVVSPSTGQSIIGFWASQPTFNNRTGEIRMEGGVPGGVNIKNGLVTTIQFRAKGAGSAAIQLDTASRVLANDGRGTDVLVQIPGAYVTIKLPLSRGPTVSSNTHPDSNVWYADGNLSLQWTDLDASVTAYSYVLDDQPSTVPDTISEGNQHSVSYEKVESGVHYFHIRALASGEWGGTSHYAVQIDTEKPAEFKLKVIPRTWTASRQPVLEFFATDAHSGIDHSEVKIIRLSQSDSAGMSSELFVDASSPYVMPPQEIGNYEVILRLYDKAQNYREVTERIHILAPLLGILTIDGIQFSENFLVPWTWIWAIAFLILLLFAIFAWRLKRWPKKLGIHTYAPPQLPDPIQLKLQELEAYQRKYGKLAVFLLMAVLSAHAFISSSVMAATQLPSPEILQVSRDLSTSDTFYVGGVVISANSSVVIYWENLTTGEARSATVSADEKGEWFYHHPETLPAGNYRLWAQSQDGNTTSPPSPQIDIAVRSAELRIGPAHIPYEMAYLLIIIVLTIILILIGIMIILHWHKIRRHHQRFMEEVRKGEESIRRGFAILRHDLELEFAGIQQLKAGRPLTPEEANREAQLMKDIDDIEEKIGEEVWEMEKLETE